VVVGLAAHAESLAEARGANGEDHELLKKVQTHKYQTRPTMATFRNYNLLSKVLRKSNVILLALYR